MNFEQKKNIDVIDNNLINYIYFIGERKKSIILKLMLASILAVAFSLTQPDVYRSSATLNTKGDDGISSSSLAGALGQFASLGGVNITSDNISAKDKVIATLNSYTFFEKIYENEIFLINLFAINGYVDGSSTINTKIYDKSKSKWVVKKPHPQIAFDKYNKGLSISENPFNPILTISFKSLSPYAANEMISFVLEEIDDYIKVNDVKESKRAIDYLKIEIGKTSIPDIREALSSMVLQYMGKLVTAEKSDQYLFDIIEMPYVPIDKFSPQRAIICITIFLITLFAELAYLFMSFIFNVSLTFSISRGFSFKKHD